MAEQQESSENIVTIDNKKYDLNSLSDEVKNDLTGLRVCQSQLRLYEDTIRLLAISRQTITNKLKEKLKDVSPIE